jgi:NAD-dependent deacetylase
MIRPDLIEKLRSCQKIAVFTGAGISAESGIPTFRGKEGYWVVGSKNYMPEEMATNEMFTMQPAELWKWYLMRFGICIKAQPNAGHFALAELEKKLGNRFQLITQNIDGLHTKAGSDEKKMFQIHGNINWMRCHAECTDDLYKLPFEKINLEKIKEIKESELFEILKCPRCEGITRPHVLWFDEMYNEQWYRFESSTERVQKTDLLIVVGTMGATNLPSRIVNLALSGKALVIDINIDKSAMSKTIESSGRGLYIEGQSGKVLPEIASFILR